MAAERPIVIWFTLASVYTWHTADAVAELRKSDLNSVALM